MHNADAFDGFLAAARTVRSNQQPALVSVVQYHKLEEFDNQTGKMRIVADRLTEAHRDLPA
jgi:hypothetical protein